MELASSQLAFASIFIWSLAFIAPWFESQSVNKYVSVPMHGWTNRIDFGEYSNMRFSISIEIEFHSSPTDFSFSQNSIRLTVSMGTKIFTDIPMNVNDGFS